MVFGLAFALAFALAVLAENLHFYRILPRDYFFSLRSQRLFLRNAQHTLATYLTQDFPDESTLVKLLEQVEFQLKRTNEVLTDYDRIPLDVVDDYK